MPHLIFENFSKEKTLSSHWKTFNKSGSRLLFTTDGLRFVNHKTANTQYINAQIDDYQHLARRDFLWQPPLTMVIQARFSHPRGVLNGTAGFGFWNDPFLMTGLRWPALPRVIWFFYSAPPSHMKLDMHAPGWGWKAGTLDALRWPFFALLPTAPLAVPLMNVDWLYQRCWPIGQRAIGVNEVLVPAEMTEWHTYALYWQPDSVRFEVDGQTILSSASSPKGPLGFVMWLDNQYMVVTPRGNFGAGLVTKDAEQWMEVQTLTIDAP